MDMPEEGVFHNIVIAKIKKDWPGQALKVMNALWGAGQMMFNKILIVTKDNVDIHDYQAVLDAVMKKTDPEKDIHFVTGPLDVLDHSGRSFAFGSKMCIDATGEDLPPAPAPSILTEKLLSEFPEIKSINDSFVRNGTGILIISVEKSGKDHIRRIIEHAIESGLINNVRYVVVADAPLNTAALNLAAWITAGNIDPQRDCFILKNNRNTEKTMVIDATRKTAEDDFQREWPNVLVMDDETIRLVDSKWNSYHLGPFLKSPSENLKPLVLNNKATV
jgi:4-hydroxy-3-polyprenylbenzoate decarboxylase